MAFVACGQFCATSAVLSNLAACQTIIRRAAKAGARCIFLPENEGNPGQFLQGLRQEAREHKVYINAGVHWPATETQASNVSVWIGPEGDILKTYKKLHLWDHLVPPFATPVGQLGLAICYDLRFPELSLRLRRLGADILAYPSAFTTRTGAAHWELLLRSTAVQTQTYVIAAAQTGKHDNQGKRVSYGHAMICDPWGAVIAQCSDIGNEPQFCLAHIDKQVLERVRVDMPLWHQRRLDIFPEI